MKISKFVSRLKLEIPEFSPSILQVLSNDALSRKAKYLIIFFAAAFLFSTVILVCFIKYHRDSKSKYKNLAQVDRLVKFFDES